MALAGKMGVPLRDQAKAEHQIMVLRPNPFMRSPPRHPSPLPPPPAGLHRRQLHTETQLLAEIDSPPGVAVERADVERAS